MTTLRRSDKEVRSDVEASSLERLNFDCETVMLDSNPTTPCYREGGVSVLSGGFVKKVSSSRTRYSR